jgi:hypothetical protein
VFAVPKSIAIDSDQKSKNAIFKKTKFKVSEINV